VKRASHGRMMVDVPDYATATEATALVAWMCGLTGVSFPHRIPGLPIPWKLAYEIDMFDRPVFLHLDQTVQDLPKGKDVFLVHYVEELPWN
jgi:hypothetical protein